MKEQNFEPLTSYIEYPLNMMKKRSATFKAMMKCRRSVRQFSSKPVSKEIIENCVAVAGSAPSGANMQPWHFVVVSNPGIKRLIRTEAEIVETEFYNNRAPEHWLKDLEPLGTNAHKPYLEIAPYLIAIFSVRHTEESDGSIRKHYYLNESVGIATGMLITAIHNCGLVCLTHTPSPMAFLRDILRRPKTEKPFLLLAVGYPDENAQVPKISKKKLDEITTFF